MSECHAHTCEADQDGRPFNLVVSVNFTTIELSDHYTSTPYTMRHLPTNRTTAYLKSNAKG